MGTHESEPSFLIQNSDENNGFFPIGSQIISLKDWISKNPNVLGEKVIQKWGSNLPFLFKVLSVGKALSIQAHPDKDLAKILHKFMPNVYKEANHKPDMALATTHFEALCGFITLQDSIADVITHVKGLHLLNLLAILEAFDGHDYVHIIDFNLMHGLQWPVLIQALALFPVSPTTIKGIMQPTVCPDGKRKELESNMQSAVKWVVYCAYAEKEKVTGK
ncbi:hypothetical protein TB2_038028 [Malus domestica]